MSRALTVTILPPALVKETSKMSAPVDRLRTSGFFKKMTPKVQSALVDEAQHLAAAIVMYQSSGLAIGERIFNIHELLNPGPGGASKGFSKILSAFKFTRRTAYRYMDAYKFAREHFPPTILQAAMASGMNLVAHSKDKPLGAYTDAFKILPPPERNPDAAGAKRYLQNLEDTRKQRNKRIAKARKKHGADKPEAVDAGELKIMLKESYRFLNLRFDRLTPRQRDRFMEELTGMMLAKVGVSSREFKATAIPDEFIAKRGRPELVKKEATVAAAAPAS